MVATGARLGTRSGIKQVRSFSLEPALGTVRVGAGL